MVPSFETVHHAEQDAPEAPEAPEARMLHENRELAELVAR